MVPLRHNQTPPGLQHPLIVNFVPDSKGKGKGKFGAEVPVAADGSARDGASSGGQPAPLFGWCLGNVSGRVKPLSGCMSNRT